MLYQLYKRYQTVPLVSTLAYAAFRIGGRWKEMTRPKEPIRCSDGRLPIKIGIICDPMTFLDFETECSLVAVTPQNWREVFQTVELDLLLCEAAWTGAKQCWRGQIYRNHTVLFENRRVLLKILDVCKKQNIKTVFWNKEDPAFWGSAQYDFVDTALRFDFIFTTAEECISRYRAMGHKQVHLLRFGFSPKLFNPLDGGQMEPAAFFAGSWYQDQPKRCGDMEELFDYVRRNGIPYTIYDRKHGVEDTLDRFPERYQEQIRPSVPFDQLDRATKKYLYALNINTVQQSETMFARRVYEMMAANHVVISNRARGLEKEFPDSVWYTDGDVFPGRETEKRRKNLEYVFCNHTCTACLDTILRTVGAVESCHKWHLYLVVADTAQVELEPYPNIEVELRRVEMSGRELSKADLAPMERDGYVAVLDRPELAARSKWTFMLAQFLYLPPECGVRCRDATYKLVRDDDNWNCLFPVCAIGPRLERFQEIIEKIDL